MFPQTDGLREFLLNGSNKYAELRRFALRYRFCVFVYMICCPGLVISITNIAFK